MVLQEKFKYLKLLSMYNEKVFSNFEENDKTWPAHRVYSNEFYNHECEFYSPYEKYTLANSEVIKLKNCYAAILQKDIYAIGVSYQNNLFTS